MINLVIEIVQVTIRKHNKFVNNTSILNNFITPFLRQTIEPMFKLSEVYFS